jgi:mannose-1-phosphate guanylyltransferase
MSFAANGHLWGTILAGGEGRRLREFILRLNCDDRPKQFCTITGTRSMLRNTIDRAQLLIPSERILTVITRHHLRYAGEQLSDRPPGTVVVQPSCRGTAVGLLLPLLVIQKRDPGAIVAVLPADHFIIENQRFMHQVDSAAEIVRADPSVIVMLGVNPDRIESGYGWVERGPRIVRCRGSILHRVRRFWEKPGEEAARLLFTSGCLWNTFVLVGHAATFLEHFRTLAPEIFEPLFSAKEILDTAAERVALKRLFDQIPTTDFSRSVLTRISAHLRVLEMTGVYWSDWGEEHRIRHDVDRFNMRLNVGKSLLASIPGGVSSLAMRCLDE